MKKQKKLISLVLALVMLIGVMAGFGVSTYAANELSNNEYEYYLNDEGTIDIAKYKGNATNLTIPNEIDGKPVTGINPLAFRDCETLISVVIPDSVTEIGYNAFIGCRSLISITIPNGVTEIKYSTFGECVKLKNVIIPNSVTGISQWAFVGCTSLTYIGIPASVEFLGPESFLGCSSLKGAIILNKECKIYDSFMDNNGGEDRFKLSDFTIYGYKNSTSQVYAEKEGYDFIAIDEPIIAEGTDTVYKQGSKNSTSIHCVYPLDAFISVSVDGKTIDEASYTLEDGSTILTFKPSYLDTLSVGKHTVTMEYTIGTISTELTIENTSANKSKTEKSEEKTTQKTENRTASGKNKSTKSPDTGCSSNFAAIISATALSVGIAFISRKKKNS